MLFDHFQIIHTSNQHALMLAAV